MSARDSFQLYFGDPDASHVKREDVAQVHAPRDFEVSGALKSHKGSHGNCIIVGVKGSGKTALRKNLECDPNALIWNVDADHSCLSIDPGMVAGRSSRIRNVIALHLLREFADQVADQSTRDASLTGKVLGKLRKAGSAGLDILKNVPSAVRVSAGVEVDLEPLFKPAAAKFVQAAWQEACDATVDALGGRRAYIMIDDAEDVFPGMERNPAYIEGIARAVVDINERASAGLHVLLFLKYGVWRYWFEHQTEYDKAKPYIQHISWRGADELAALIARRVASKHDVKYEDGAVEELWRRDFAWTAEFRTFYGEVASYCTSGPRDMIDLLNRAKLKAGKQRVTLEHVHDVLKSFSEEKLFGLNADFGDVYPEVGKLVEIVFRGAVAIRAGKEIADTIEERVLMDKGVSEALGLHDWFRLTTKERLLQVMYDVGVVGRVAPAGGTIYAIESPQEPASSLRESRLEVHRAFRPYLGVVGP
ncbi:MAG: hypothetical protein IT379_30370 [Deltaproteobacteria bacterium]|nr:hypothetical protein [Deltaproteobacteria bacterium]